MMSPPHAILSAEDSAFSSAAMAFPPSPPPQSQQSNSAFASKKPVSTGLLTPPRESATISDSIPNPGDKAELWSPLTPPGSPISLPLPTPGAFDPLLQDSSLAAFMSPPVAPTRLRSPSDQADWGCKLLNPSDGLPQTPRSSPELPNAPLTPPGSPDRGEVSESALHRDSHVEISYDEMSFDDMSFDDTSFDDTSFDDMAFDDTSFDDMSFDDMDIEHPDDGPEDIMASPQPQIGSQDVVSSQEQADDVASPQRHIVVPEGAASLAELAPELKRALLNLSCGIDVVLRAMANQHSLASEQTQALQQILLAEMPGLLYTPPTGSAALINRKSPTTYLTPAPYLPEHPGNTKFYRHLKFRELNLQDLAPAEYFGWARHFQHKQWGQHGFPESAIGHKDIHAVSSLIDENYSVYYGTGVSETGDITRYVSWEEARLHYYSSHGCYASSSGHSWRSALSCPAETWRSAQKLALTSRGDGKAITTTLRPDTRLLPRGVYEHGSGFTRAIPEILRPYGTLPRVPAAPYAVRAGSPLRPRPATQEARAKPKTADSVRVLEGIRRQQLPAEEQQPQPRTGSRMLEQLRLFKISHAHLFPEAARAAAVAAKMK
ncbi:hypothetical protein FN846DRAFT_916090 [Sphaerosporella brunnea]|uniref:Uncharacterized protein n=1 Tax=Sphaerosporella brunnea TaxID=1250544 RepID=A0A5J5F984_9PEZI|nr:hypothetical protein FN846DRAFT_916090 [Sphaerosporella brunnea]